MNLKTITGLALAAGLSVAGALAATSPASASVGDCQAGFCGRTVSTDLSPTQALAHSASNRVISTSNLQTGDSLYDVKPAPGNVACPSGWGNVYKTFRWDKAGDAGASPLGWTVVNNTQLYDRPLGSNPTAEQEFCFNPNDGAWAPRSGGEIKFNFNGTPVSVVYGQPGTATQFLGVNH